LAFQVGQAAQGEQQKPGPPKKTMRKNESQQSAAAQAFGE
jgi:hypothetical protein